jgi:hypothetical protein
MVLSTVLKLCLAHPYAGKCGGRDILHSTTLTLFPKAKITQQGTLQVKAVLAKQ